MQAAQPQASAGVRNRLEALATELKLTDEQKLKLKDVFQGPTEKIKELRANTNLTPEQKMKEYQAIQEKVDPQVKEILTPEQFAKWQAEREKWRAEMRQKLGKQQSSDK
jgi:Spy/CpxP family protein refolding chaperone